MVATPRGFLTQRIIELAHCKRIGVDMAIMGEAELAFGLLDYALRSISFTPDRANAVVQRVRVGGAFERDP
jgi:CPA2 family monovalent cation:H+ antiporter-2